MRKRDNHVLGGCARRCGLARPRLRPRGKLERPRIAGSTLTIGAEVSNSYRKQTRAWGQRSRKHQAGRMTQPYKLWATAPLPVSTVQTRITEASFNDWYDTQKRLHKRTGRTRVLQPQAHRRRRWADKVWEDTRLSATPGRHLDDALRVQELRPKQAACTVSRADAAPHAGSGVHVPHWPVAAPKLA